MVVLGCFRLRIEKYLNAAESPGKVSFLFWLLLDCFVCASVFSGCFLRFVLGLGCGFWFVWLLL